MGPLRGRETAPKPPPKTAHTAAKTRGDAGWGPASGGQTRKRVCNIHSFKPSVLAERQPVGPSFKVGHGTVTAQCRAARDNSGPRGA